jgi:lysylphosphatidylglycerol synthetase-like protein (DUF2156 family)
MPARSGYPFGLHENTVMTILFVGSALLLMGLGIAVVVKGQGRLALAGGVVLMVIGLAIGLFWLYIYLLAKGYQK